jgi:hypothetical protein
MVAMRMAERKKREADRHARYQAKKHGIYLTRPLWLQQEEEDEDEDGEIEPKELRGLRCHICSVAADEYNNTLNRLVGFLGNAAHSRQCCRTAKTEVTFIIEFDSMDSLILFGRTHVLVTGFTLWRFHRELAARGIWTLPKRTEAELAQLAAEKEERLEERRSRKRSKGAGCARTEADPIIAYDYKYEFNVVCKKRAEEFARHTRMVMATLRRSAGDGDGIEENTFNEHAPQRLSALVLPFDENTALAEEIVYISHCQAGMERFMYNDHPVRRELVVGSDWERNDAEMTAEGFSYSDTQASRQTRGYRAQDDN